MLEKMKIERQRGIAVLIAAFAVVLIGGIALAQIGTMSGGGDQSGEPAPLSSATSANPAPTPATTAVAAEARMPIEATTFPAEPPSDEPKPPVDEVEPPVDDEEPPEDDTTPPKLAILRPDDGAHTSDETITVKGETEPGAVVTYGSYEADRDDAGFWAIRIKLDIGHNVLVFHATDEAGNTSEASITVIRDEPKPEPEPEPDHKFTAHQKWEAVDGEPVVNKYYGTAKPDTKIWIVSDYGKAETRADKNGEWFVAVTFNETNCNTSWKVVVEADSGHRAEFRMKRVCETDTKFTAHQKYGSCGEAVPYDIFYGPGTPGLEVKVDSDWGRGSTVIGEDGKWRIKVEFPEAPFDKKFRVKVKNSAGGLYEFWFVRTGDKK